MRIQARANKVSPSSEICAGERQRGDGQSTRAARGKQMRKPLSLNSSAQLALESCNLGRMLQAPPPPDAATASAPGHGASGNPKHPSGSKAFAASGRPHKKKLLAGLMFALVFCPVLLCQTPPSHTPVSSDSLP